MASFEQLKVIGRGGFSRVVLCRKRDTGMLYAMKIVAKSTAKRHRVLAEKDIMTRLDHPRILKLHWAFQTQSELFFVLEVCPCGELFTHMQRKFTEPEVKFYIAQVVEAIEYLHAQGVLYRDLKPENCLVDCHGNLKLADFGLSKLTQEKTYSFCGSPEYLSPEMLTVNGHDYKSDVY